MAGPESARFEPDDRVGGRYRILRLLGKGGMGEVYEAWDEELSIPVALKTLRWAGDADHALRQLKLEGMLARSVWHPNVCRVYDLGRHDQGAATWFLTMELLQGEPLSERLHEGRLPLDEVLRLAEQMAAGLAAAHHAGVVHRDFKPGNVLMVSREGGEQAVITDFGTACAARRPRESSDHPERVIGTPAYMAPEQVRGEDAGAAADVYAFGIVLYEMVTGRLPFAADSAFELATRRIHEEPPSPRSVVPDLDSSIERAILRCLARAPSDRFARVEDVVDALAGRAPATGSGAADRGARARHNLPAERDLFVGREPEIDALRSRLERGARLVTLLGAGGMGKTRLATRCGWRLLEEWPGGIWFCDLTEARSLDGIARAVADALGVQLGRGDPIERLGHALEGRGRCLVILDNVEQVVAGAAQALERWLRATDLARFVVTSRERLHLDREDVQRVDSLGPEAGLELLVARARALRPSFAPAGAEAMAAREIVRLVDGMPLAIELAAARLRVMSALAIVEQMRKRFRLLTGGRDARHETLEGMIDGSVQLLEPWERAAWTQCAVFEGGFTLDAAQSVLDLSAWPEAPWTVDIVRSLVDKSLLRTWAPQAASATTADVRFGMYVSLQEYARLKLVSEGARARDAETRHGAWCARLGRPESIERLDLHGGVKRRAALALEFENLVAACHRALERGQGGIATDCLQAAWEVLELRGPYRLGVELAASVLAAPLEPADRARALTVAGRAAWRSGRMDETRGHYEAALAIHRARGDRRSEGFVLAGLANLPHEQGRVDEARRHYAAALAIHREVGDRRLEGIALGNLAILGLQQGRMEEARADFESALAIHQEVGDRRFEGIVLYTLGALHYEQGRMDAARAHYERSLAIHRELGDRRYEGIVLGNLSLVDRAQGEIDDARAHDQIALAIHRELGDRRSEAVALGNLGNLDLDQDRREEARVHLEAALAIHREAGSRQFEGIVLGALGRLHFQQGDRDRARDAFARGEALLREVGDAIGLGEILCARALFEHALGERAAARAALAEAEGLAAQVGAGDGSELGRDLAHARRTLSP